MISRSSITLSRSFQFIPAVSCDFPQIPGFSRYFPLAKECGSVPQWSRKYKLPIRVQPKSARRTGLFPLAEFSPPLVEPDVEEGFFRFIVDGAEDQERTNHQNQTADYGHSRTAFHGDENFVED